MRALVLVMLCFYSHRSKEPCCKGGAPHCAHGFVSVRGRFVRQTRGWQVEPGPNLPRKSAPCRGIEHGAQWREGYANRSERVDEALLRRAAGFVPLEHAGVGEDVAEDVAHAVADDLLGGVLGDVGVRRRELERPGGVRGGQRIGRELVRERRRSASPAWPSDGP